MFISTFKKRLLFLTFSLFISNIIMFLIFQEIFYSNNILIDFAIHPFNICIKYPQLWKFIKITYILSFNISVFSASTLICSVIFKKEEKKNNKTSSTKENIPYKKDLNLLVGKDQNDNLVYIGEKGLYQNILITGTIGSGKTSSAMYPFTKQLIEYKAEDKREKLGLLILDVKGNYYKQVKNYCNLCGREKDLIVLSLNRKY